MRRLPLCVLTGVLAVAGFTWQASAQDGPPRREGGNAERPEGRGGPGMGFQIIPRFVAEQLKLSDEQKAQIAELEKEVKAKLDKILTDEQKKILAEARPPRGGQGRGPGGEGGQGQGGRPPREGGEGGRPPREGGQGGQGGGERPN